MVNFNRITEGLKDIIPGLNRSPKGKDQEKEKDRKRNDDDDDDDD